MQTEIYEFLTFAVNRHTAELRCNDDPVTVEPKAFDLLCYLIEHRNRTVGKEELLENIWPGVIVSETALTGCVKKLRRAVGDSRGMQSVIKTIPRRGYRFIATITKRNIGPSRSDNPSLVVLPFAAVADDSESEALANELTQNIIAKLSRSDSLSVIAQSTSLGYKGQTVKGGRAAAELGVQYLVEGLVRQVGDEMRITVHLVEAATETQRWTEKYRRPVSDLLLGQDEIAKVIATALGSELRRADGGHARMAELPTIKTEHFDQKIRICTSADGVRLAYAISGEGPPLVQTARYLTHLEHDWPVWRHWLSELPVGRTLIRYDARGSGLSDRNVDDFSMHALIRDLETVVDAMKLGRFPLLGISQGVSVAVAYAAKHPDRVSHLVLYGGYARGRFNRDLSSDQLL